MRKKLLGVEHPDSSKHGTSHTRITVILRPKSKVSKFFFSLPTPLPVNDSWPRAPLIQTMGKLGIDLAYGKALNISTALK